MLKDFYFHFNQNSSENSRDRMVDCIFKFLKRVLDSDEESSVKVRFADFILAC
jgi:hypothetical protein